MVTEAERFAARLNEALDDLGYPKERGRIIRVAKDWSLSTTAVRKWLRGEGMPDTKRISDLAMRYNVNAEWLLTGRGPKRGVSGIPHATLLPVPPMRQLPIYSWEAAARGTQEGENYMGVPFETGPNGFILTVETDAMWDTYPKGGFVIVDPDLEAESEDIVVAIAEGATIPILRKLVIEGGKQLLIASARGYGDGEKASRIIGPVVGYWRPGKQRT